MQKKNNAKLVRIICKIIKVTTPILFLISVAIYLPMAILGWDHKTIEPGRTIYGICIWIIIFTELPAFFFMFPLNDPFGYGPHGGDGWC